jgi:hypothetical protein
VQGTLDTSCIARIAPPAIVDAFPSRLQDEAPATSVLPRAASELSPDDLRAVAVVRDAVSDVLWRWGAIGILSGRGLRGGTFAASGPLGRDNIAIQLRDIEWTTDTKVSGVLHVTPDSDVLDGAITLTTPTSTIGLRVQSNLFDATTVMTISGTLSGHPVDLLVDAPISL